MKIRVNAIENKPYESSDGFYKGSVEKGFINGQVRLTDDYLEITFSSNQMKQAKQLFEKC